ncbi:MAG: iron-sulfur cluster assembly protein, partial [Gemmatimonadota bacterium]
MDVQSIRERVESALRRVKPTGAGEDVVSLGLIGDVQVDEAGAVSVLLGLRPSDDASLADTVGLVLSGVEGVSGVEVRTAEAAGPVTAPPEGTVPAAPRPRESGKAKRSLPVVGPRG